MKIILENEPSGYQTELKDLTDAQLFHVKDAAEANLEARGVYRDIKPVSCGVLHELKTWPVYFDQIWEGYKNFEVRKNDRAFQKGDIVLLKEFDPNKTGLDSHKYTGRKIHAEIGFVLSEMQKEGHVTFSLLNIERIK